MWGGDQQENWIIDFFIQGIKCLWAPQGLTPMVLCMWPPRATPLGWSSEREREAEWIPRHFAYSLLCSKTTPTRPVWRTGRGGNERERERFQSYSSILSKQEQPARKLYLASPHAIFRTLPLFEAFIRKRLYHINRWLFWESCFMWWVHYMLPLTSKRSRWKCTHAEEQAILCWKLKSSRGLPIYRHSSLNVECIHV